MNVDFGCKIKYYLRSCKISPSKKHALFPLSCSQGEGEEFSIKISEFRFFYVSLHF